MVDLEGGVLPYRVSPDELGRWINARARGRSPAQLRELGLSTKTLEGLQAAASALGWVDEERGDLTPEGERFALATETERREALRAAVLRFPPYRRLLAAVGARPQRSSTDTQWIETWWATHGYGSSPSNRAEGAAALGRLVEWAGWGRFVPGRRGHPTRIEWSPAALREVERRVEPAEGREQAPESDLRSDPLLPAPQPRRPPEVGERPSRASAVPQRAGVAREETERNRVTVPLEGGQVARLEVPQRLSAGEKRRLLSLLDLLIREE